MKSYTNIEQSKKLAEILPIESADHHYVRRICDFMGNPVDGKWSEPKYGNPNSEHANYIVQNFTSYEKLPCWSLAALLKVLSETARNIDEDGSVDISSYKDIEWEISMINCDISDIITSNDLIDACVEMIYKLKEKDLI